MKAIVLSLIVIVALAVNVYGQTKEQSAALVKKVADTCMKKRKVTKEEIMACVLTDVDDWASDPECTKDAQCFMDCGMGMAFVLDKNKCFDCDKGKGMIDKFMKSPDMQEAATCLKKGIDECCYDLQKEDCCKNLYQLIQCMYPICGEIMSDSLTGF